MVSQDSTSARSRVTAHSLLIHLHSQCSETKLIAEACQSIWRSSRREQVVRWSTSRVKISHRLLSLCIMLPSRRKTFVSDDLFLSCRNRRAMDLIRSIYRENGIRGFYKGNDSLFVNELLHRSVEQEYPPRIWVCLKPSFILLSTSNSKLNSFFSKAVTIVRLMIPIYSIFFPIWVLPLVRSHVPVLFVIPTKFSGHVWEKKGRSIERLFKHSRPSCMRRASRDCIEACWRISFDRYR